MPSIVMNLNDMARLAHTMRSVVAEYELLGRRLQGFRVPGLPSPANYGAEAAARSVGVRLRGLAGRLGNETRQLEFRRSIAARDQQNIWIGASAAFGSRVLTVRNAPSSPSGSSAVVLLGNIPSAKSIVTLPGGVGPRATGGYTLNPAALLGVGEKRVVLSAGSSHNLGGGITLDPAAVLRAQSQPGVTVLPTASSGSVGAGYTLKPVALATAGADQVTLQGGSLTLTSGGINPYGSGVLTLPATPSRDWGSHSYEENLAYALRDGEITVRESTALSMGVVSEKQRRARDLLVAASRGQVDLDPSLHPILTNTVTAPIDILTRYEPPPPEMSPDLDWDYDGVPNRWDSRVNDPYES
jgi:hypothetical protein